MELKDIYWVAGILEGEGSFGFYRGSPCIQVQMTDKDVIERVASILGLNMRSPWVRKDGHKPVWSCVASGKKAAQWMMTLLPILGERRREKVEDSIRKWRASPNIPRASRGSRLPAICHPEKPRMGWMLCKACYMRQWRVGRKSGVKATKADYGYAQIR